MLCNELTQDVRQCNAKRWPVCPLSVSKVDFGIRWFYVISSARLFVLECFCWAWRARFRFWLDFPGVGDECMYAYVHTLSSLVTRTFFLAFVTCPKRISNRNICWHGIVR
jgi:hypothetical protein